jgi:hypothetical protein
MGNPLQNQVWLSETECMDGAEVAVMLLSIALLRKLKTQFRAYRQVGVVWGLLQFFPVGGYVSPH